MIVLPDLGRFREDEGLVPLDRTTDGRFSVGTDGVRAIAATGDRKIEFVGFGAHTIALVRSALGHPAYYPIVPASLQRPIQAVLMDLDGTTVRSEHFWTWIIEQTTATLLGNPAFQLDAADLPYVAGHSVSEHLQHCIAKYCPDRTVEAARDIYFEHTHREMQEILEGRGRVDAFVPSPGLGEFLRELKQRDIRVALVTSGLHEKAWPEIVAVFRQLGLGDPASFYDVIITAGFPLGRGSPGTLGELSPKPHPWLYAEAFRVGLGLPVEERAHVLGLEDSAAGICSLRLAGFAPVGMTGGNILESGASPLCHALCSSFDEVLGLIDTTGR